MIVIEWVGKSVVGVQVIRGTLLKLSQLYINNKYRDAGGGGACAPPPSFRVSFNPICTKGGRLCPPYY